jgi:hypothetical protein
VLADRERLERVVGHLIQNAIEATPRDGHVMIVSAARLTPMRRGRDRDHRHRRRHERGIHPRAPVQALRLDQVGRHGHRRVREPRIHHRAGRPLEVSSQPALGTTFKVVLPLYHEPAAATLDSVP